MDDTLRDALATVEPFAQFNPEDLAVERLGGLNQHKLPSQLTSW